MVITPLPHTQMRLRSSQSSSALVYPADMILARPVDLRAQLAAVISTSQNQQQSQSQHPQHHGGPPHGYSEAPASSSASPHEHNIDPSIGGGMMSTGGGDSGGDDNLDGRKGGKRELSQSKRAAQNRAAQVCYLDFLVVVVLVILEVE
jgi:cobalamin biosynthesis Mg chelatase CobN